MKNKTKIKYKNLPKWNFPFLNLLRFGFDTFGLQLHTEIKKIIKLIKELRHI